MLNSIWFGMILASILCALVTGRLGELSNALMDGAQTAVELSLFLLGSMCAWLGFLKIAEESGLSRLLAKVLSPVIGRLFPEYREEEEIQGKISMNLSANLLGLGNAATPLGLAAMKAMAQSRGFAHSRHDSFCSDEYGFPATNPHQHGGYAGQCRQSGALWNPSGNMDDFRRIPNGLCVGM